QAHLARGETQVDVRQQRARQQTRLAQNLEAVADPEHRPAFAGELDHRLHRLREARDRTGAQVVPVGEAARDDDRVGALQVAVAMPDQLGVPHVPRGLDRVHLVAGAGELQYTELQLTISIS